jgi:uncharacterized protein YjiS (DUF1127 family)
MDTIYIAVGARQAIITQATAVTRAGLTIFKGWLAALREWRERQAVRSRLNDLSNHELLDIGISRGEIDYVASNRTNDPRNVFNPGSL